MDARKKSTITLALVALVLFIAHWAVDAHICDPRIWTTKWGNPNASSEGSGFFSSVIKGGSGTPAIFAMLGGQRYIIANLLWEYADVLFHQDKKYKVANALEACVTLKPSFTDAWSLYGWHLAWNLYIENKNDAAIQYAYLEEGLKVYERAVMANPDRPEPYFDIAWLYSQRMFDNKSAVKWLEQVVTKPELVKALQDRVGKTDIEGSPWRPDQYFRQLAVQYRMVAVISGVKNEGPAYLQKAIDIYDRSLEYLPKDGSRESAAERAQITKMAKELRDNIRNPTWYAEQLARENTRRTNFGFDTVSPASERSGSEDAHSDHAH